MILRYSKVLHNSHSLMLKYSLQFFIPGKYLGTTGSEP